MNYGNRNASSTYSNQDLARGYFGAVFTSVSIAMASRTMLAAQLAKMRGPQLVFANACLNYFAACVPGVCNCSLMRWKELQEGINVKDSDGKDHGKSVVAGKKAIMQTSASRFILPLPVLFFPAFANALLTKMRLWPRNMILSKFFELSLCAISLTFALPMSIALFD